MWCRLRDRLRGRGNLRNVERSDLCTSLDDGEEFGGRRVLRTMAEEGIIDAVVIVSRWQVISQ